MFIVTPEQIRQIDKRAIEEFGIPGIVLMENAALQTIKVILEHYPLTNLKSVLVLAGCGNNGGDGFAIARHLFLAGYQVNVIIVSEGGRKPQGDAEVNLKALYSLFPSSLQIHWLEEEKDLARAKVLLRETDLIIDALFGTGLDRPVKGLYAAIIHELNHEAGSIEGQVVAVDIPSGINGETGQIMGAAIKANHTVSFGYLKPGHLLFPGREYSGKIHVMPISLPSDSATSIGANLFTLNDYEAAQMLKPRPRNSHKGTFGKVAVIAGSTGMTGAAHLTAQSAMRSGAGQVTLGIPASLNPILEEKLTEVMTHPLEDKGLGHLTMESLQDINQLMQDKDVLAFGPGCGKNSGVFEILRNILGGFHIPIVIDADGLNHISKDMSLIRSHKAPVILTPHPGEMSRLSGLDVQDILSRPVEVAAETANKYGCIVLLKGAASVVAEPKGRVYINASGSSGMAKGGSGDVLTGMIASLIAQGYPAFEATVLGCFIHGRAGENAANKIGETGMVAGDLMDAMPHTFKGLYELAY